MPKRVRDRDADGTHRRLSSSPSPSPSPSPSVPPRPPRVFSMSSRRAAPEVPARSEGPFSSASSRMAASVARRATSPWLRGRLLVALAATMVRRRARIGGGVMLERVEVSRVPAGDGRGDAQDARLDCLGSVVVVLVRESVEKALASDASARTATARACSRSRRDRGRDERFHVGAEEETAWPRRRRDRAPAGGFIAGGGRRREGSVRWRGWFVSACRARARPAAAFIIRTVVPTLHQGGRSDVARAGPGQVASCCS